MTSSVFRAKNPVVELIDTAEHRSELRIDRLRRGLEEGRRYLDHIADLIDQEIDCPPPSE